MKEYIRFLVLWLVNLILILLGNSFFPKNLVLGGFLFSKFAAGIFSGLLLTAIVWFSAPLLKKFVVKKKTNFELFTLYFFLNSVAVWICARAAFLTGFGISRFYWAFLFGLVISFFQHFVRQALNKYKFT